MEKQFETPATSKVHRMGLILTGSKKYGTKYLLCLLFKENQPSSWEDTKKMNKVKSISEEE